MSKHTKGPWKAKRLATYQEPGWVVLWPDKGGTHMRRLDYKGNLTEADARLIAAAPELLEALEELVESSEESTAFLAKARAAIAKANEREAV